MKLVAPHDSPMFRVLLHRRRAKGRRTQTRITYDSNRSLSINRNINRGVKCYLVQCVFCAVSDKFDRGYALSCAGVEYFSAIIS